MDLIRPIPTDEFKKIIKYDKIILATLSQEFIDFIAE
jgi:NAD(P)H-nitrite reductase large subunit